MKLGTRIKYSRTIVPIVSKEVQTDDQGRITIPEDVRDRYGDTFRLVALDSGIKLVPLPSDPLQELRAAASHNLREAALDDLEATAHKEARKQATELGR